MMEGASRPTLTNIGKMITIIDDGGCKQCSPSIQPNIGKLAANILMVMEFMHTTYYSLMISDGLSGGWYV